MPEAEARPDDFTVYVILEGEKAGRFMTRLPAKKRASGNSERDQSHELGGLRKSGLIHTMAESGSVVKSLLSNVEDSAQFKEWFGKIRKEKDFE